jgi:serine phosphatase RsbU (regulator of sigma subunit)
VRGGRVFRARRRFRRVAHHEGVHSTWITSEQLAVEQLGTALIVPMHRGEETIGFMSLGRKLSDQEFEPDEIEFLAGAADQTASAIYRLGLRKQAQEYEEAREIQERLLPKQIPQAPGLEISGSSRPARVVGGDYFDVFKFGDDNLGLCIGDVSGKRNAHGFADVQPPGGGESASCRRHLAQRAHGQG